MASKLSAVRRWAGPAIAVVVLAVLVAISEPAKLWEIAQGSSPLALAYALPAALVILTLKTARWRLLMGNTARAMSFGETWLVFNAGVVFGSLSPGRVGELIKVGYVMRRGIHRRNAISSVIGDRLIDVFVLGSLVVVSATVVPTSVLGNRLAVITGIGAILVVAGAMLLWRRPLLNRLDQLITRFEARFRGTSSVSPAPGDDAAPQRQPGWLPLSITLTLAASAVNVSIYLVIAEGLGLDLAPLLGAAISLLAIGVTILPISIAGIGTREAFLVVALRPLGVDYEQALLFGLSFLFVQVVFSALGFASWLLIPSSRRQGLR